MKADRIARVSPGGVSFKPGFLVVRLGLGICSIMPNLGLCRLNADFLVLQALWAHLLLTRQHNPLRCVGPQCVTLATTLIQ